MTTFAEDLYRDLAPLAKGDADQDFALQKFCESIAKPFEIVQTLVRDADTGEVGWSILLDPNRVPDEFLPWLRQLAGVKIILGESPAILRQRIKEAEGFDRGTPGSIMARAITLGMPNTLLQERYEGNAWRVRFLFVAEEFTEDKMAELVRLLPAGISWEHDFWSGTTYEMSELTAGTYAEAEATATTYGDTEEF